MRPSHVKSSQMPSHRVSGPSWRLTRSHVMPVTLYIISLCHKLISVLVWTHLKGIYWFLETTSSGHLRNCSFWDFCVCLIFQPWRFLLSGCDWRPQNGMGRWFYSQQTLLKTFNRFKTQNNTEWQHYILEHFILKWNQNCCCLQTPFFFSLNKSSESLPMSITWQ